MKYYKLIIANEANNEEGFEEFTWAFTAETDDEAKRYADEMYGEQIESPNCMGATLYDENEEELAAWLGMPG